MKGEPMKLYRLTLLLLAIPISVLLWSVAKTTIDQYAADELQAEMRWKDPNGDGLMFWDGDEQ